MIAEPTGLGAVVQSRGMFDAVTTWIRVTRGPVRPWHEVLSGGYDEYDACRRNWDQLGEVFEVVHPGIGITG